MIESLLYVQTQGLIQDSNGQGIGKVKISYIVDVQKKNTVGQLNSIANVPANKLRPENSQFGQMSFMKIPDQMPSYIQTSSVEEPMVGSGLELDDETIAPVVEYPCTFILCELSAFELMPVHSVGKNVPSIKVHCGNFYQTTPVSLLILFNISFTFGCNVNIYFPFYYYYRNAPMD
ncbi:hypothetical protein EON65_08950 [archaeon]|nr:MAG: hypothetical protein EON65_08950 [archaeon]